MDTEDQIAAPLGGVATGLVVETCDGLVRGVIDEGIASFKGVPYAAPPTGDYRWRPPQPVTAWAGERDATSFGPDCLQPASVGIAAQGPPLRTEPSEDCLYLNVWAPAGAAAGSPLPVIFWIHGGAFIVGGSSPDLYSGRNFARDGVIFVSLNYRIGRFGFFAHPSLSDEGYGANFGILDQIAALQWVQDNIAAFGGDPKRVTIFGYSAGGFSVNMLLQSPLARGLFSGAIVQSGGGRTDLIRCPTVAEAAAMGDRFLPGLSAKELRDLPASRIVGGAVDATTTDQSEYPGSILDGRTIFGSALDAARAGLVADVPMIIGANSGDGFPMVLDTDIIFASYGENAGLARTLFDETVGTDSFAIAIAANADRLFIEPARAITQALAARKHKVWLYRFASMNPAFGDVSKMDPTWSGSWGGAPHGSEVGFVFDTLDARLFEKTVSGERDTASLIHDYWVSFAKTGCPGTGTELPRWPAAEAGDNRIMIIGENGAQFEADPIAARLDLAQRQAEERPAPASV